MNFIHAMNRGFFLVALALGPALATSSARGEDYSGIRDVPPGAASAALFDPFDPLPSIGCHAECCGRDCIVYDHHRLRRVGRAYPEIDVDCSQHNRSMAPSIGVALAHIAPNGIIRVLPPGPGMTCVESLVISAPVTIESLGTERGAVIQAPDGLPCIVANIPLGDSFKLLGVKVIARGRSAPCVQVRAGIVEVDDSDIDSRNTSWAFDVADSGELRIRDTKVETDGSGIHAYRALVDISGLGIDMSPNRRDAALQLERTDGSVDKVEVIGGRWGVLASPGAHGLGLTNVEVKDANTGVELVGGGQGTVEAHDLWLKQNRNALVIGPFVSADVGRSMLLGSEDNAIVAYGAQAVVHDNTIRGGHVGIRVARADEFQWTDVPLRPLDDPPEPAAPEFVGNHVGFVGQADVFADQHAFAHFSRNVLAAPPGCACIAGDKGGLTIDDNDCVGGPLAWSGVEEEPSLHWGLWFQLGIPGLVSLGAGIGGGIGSGP